VAARPKRVTIRLIATDLDGTLFGPDHRPAPRTVAAINAAYDAGIHVTAATGRSYFRGAALAPSTGAKLHHFIGSNGGHRLDYSNGELDERLTFPEDQLREMTSVVRRELGNIGFGFEMSDDMAWDERFTELSPFNLDGEHRSVRRPPDSLVGVGKVLLAHPDVHEVELVNLVASIMPSGVNVTTSGAHFVELTPPGADKGAAVARLAEKLGIDASETLAFGDNQNDLTMLSWAGRGVAMGNAHPLAQAAANEHTVSNEDFGVAVVIEELLSGGSASTG
jgi:Cof subfamily protein (haloacid dehalogenase superfamily)